MSSNKQKNERNRVAFFISKYPNDFTTTPDKKLFCKICNKIITSKKAFHINSHIDSECHKKSVQRTAQRVQTFINVEPKENKFSDLLLKAFLSANIPLYKVRNANMKNLFNFMNHPMPSESTLRRSIDNAFDDNLQNIKSILFHKPIFVIVDETRKDNVRYANVLMGILEVPDVVYMVECKEIVEALNGSYICNLVNSCLLKMEIELFHFYLLISDAARYMTSAGKMLKSIYNNLFHITCVAHLYHNAAMKIMSNFIELNDFISGMQTVLCKNLTRQQLFIDIKLPPTTVVTRWGSWLKTALYYADNFVAVLRIIEEFEDDGKIVARVKTLAKNVTIKKQMVNIASNYVPLINLIEKSEKMVYSIKSAYHDIINLKIDIDECGIHQYMLTRLEGGDIRRIMSMENETINPSIYAMLLNSQATSIMVERSFSMLKKICADDRNFAAGNLGKYLILYYNYMSSDIDNK